MSPRRSSKRRLTGASGHVAVERFPHAKYGCEREPDTYIEPFVAYRAWNWKADCITSLNAVPWVAGEAFEAVCNRGDIHPTPDTDCTCGMYAGINMQHLIDIDYIGRGIHGEVSLWGRLLRHTLGWRAQFAYPKNFIVPIGMIPLELMEAKNRLDMLTQFGVPISLQVEREAVVGQTTLPLWMPDFGYSQQGLSALVDKRAEWYDKSRTMAHVLAVGDRVAVLNVGGGIGVVKEITGDDVFYNLFDPKVVYRKSIKTILWNERNWRWETSGLGGMRRLA